MSNQTDKPKSLQEMFTGLGPGDLPPYDWKRTVDWTKVINGVVFAVLVISVVAILVFGGVLHG
jgi:hypothetical protein